MSIATYRTPDSLTLAQEAIARVSLNADVTQCMDGVTVCFFPQHADLVYCLLTRSAF